MINVRSPATAEGDRLIGSAPRSSNVESEDPTVVRVIVVTVADVVAALEANERRDAGAVLRMNPPFSARMRARLHLEGTEHPYGDPAPIHIPPERLVEQVPPFPNPDQTEDELRADPEIPYSQARHRRYHERAVEEWRNAVREAFVEETSFKTPSGSHVVRVAALGS